MEYEISCILGARIFIIMALKWKEYIELIVRGRILGIDFGLDVGLDVGLEPDLILGLELVDLTLGTKNEKNT